MSTYPGASQNQGRSERNPFSKVRGRPDPSQALSKRFPARVAVTVPNTWFLTGKERAIAVEYSYAGNVGELLLCREHLAAIVGIA